MSVETSIWINGQPVTDDGPHLSPLDRGLTLADGVFETMRAQDGRVFRVDRHLARLRDALSVLRIDTPPALEETLTRAVAPTRGRRAIRLTITRGPDSRGVRPSGDERPTTIIAVQPWPAFAPAIYETGLALHVASGRRNERAMTAGLKTLAYAESILALVEATRAGADDALWLDTCERCSEATSSNLFAWTGRALLTPPIACGALPGITRAAVLECAADLGIPALERAFGLDELVAADEIFLTSSLRGIAPVVRVDTRVIGAGVPGTVTQTLAARYAALLLRECGASYGS